MSTPITSPLAAGALLAMVVSAAAAPLQAQDPVPPAAAAPAPASGPSASGGQTDAPRAMPRDPATDARYKVRIMEGVLEKAVLQAALLMNQQLQSVSPELIQLTGAARARGYRLDGYGLFFDVEVPAAMRQTMGWTARLLRQRNETLQEALASLKRLSDSLDGPARSEAELAVRQIEFFVLPPAARPGARMSGLDLVSGATGGGGVGVAAASSMPAAASPPPDAPSPAAESDAAPRSVAPAAEPVRRSINPLVLQNPDLAYELEVREALIGAMIEWGGLLPLTAGEWLTVAARDNQDVVIPGEAADVVTIIMRVRAADLASYRAGGVTLDELRRRVEVREF